MTEARPLIVSELNAELGESNRAASAIFFNNAGNSYGVLGAAGLGLNVCRRNSS